MGEWGLQLCLAPMASGEGSVRTYLQKNMGVGSLESGCKLRGAPGMQPPDAPCVRAAGRAPCACRCRREHQLWKAEGLGRAGGQAGARQAGTNAPRRLQEAHVPGWVRHRVLVSQGPVPAWPCRAPLSSMSRAHGVCHLALGLGLRPVGRGNYMVRSSLARAGPGRHVWVPRPRLSLCHHHLVGCAICSCVH